ncbi:MAG: hypothetical protein N4A31_03045 [Rickettsiales bacterium]|jgi:uncharacterized protein YhfF|nr:hypothetical protein [Rickettsiales bacterium]
MSKIKCNYKNLEQLREEYPDIAMEYSKNLKKVQDSPDLASYQKLYDTVLKLEEVISPVGKAKLLAPLIDAARGGDINAVRVIDLQSNDTRFEAELQEYTEKIVHRRGKGNFSLQEFQSEYKRAIKNIEKTSDEDSKRAALFEVTGLLHKTYRIDGIDDEFRNLLLNQREVFETRILDHDAAVKLRSIRAGERII